jgi:phage terminase large subunit-like protein
MSDEVNTAATLAELDVLENRLKQQLEDLKGDDPFYFYQPSDGDLSPEAKDFLKQHLREEDIPVRCDSQMDAHTCTAETIANFGGNQGGKTTWLVIEALIHATGELPEALKDVYPKEKMPVEKMRYLRLEGESDTQVDEILVPAIRYWVPRNFLIKRSWDESYNAKAKILTLQKFNREVASIKFNSFTQDASKLQGKKLTFVGYDEEPPKKHREENLLRFTTANRLCERFAMTPTKGVTWVKEEILDKQGPTTRAFKMASVINKHANLKVLNDVISKLTTYEAKKMRLLGEFISLSGLIYGGLFNRSVHMIEPFPVGCNCQQVERDDTHSQTCAWRKYMIVRGMDVHTVKPAACVEMAIDSSGQKYVVGVYNPKICVDMEQLKLDLANRVADRGYRLRWTIIDKSLDYAIEAAGGLNLYKKLVRGANKIRPMYKSEKFVGSIVVGVDEIKQCLKVSPVTKKPGILFFNTPEVNMLINDIETLERDTYVDEDRRGQKDAILEGKKDRHSAFRYIFQRKITWHGPDDVQYIPPDFGDEESYI